MEEEVDYSTVVFIDAPPSKEKKEEPAIYSEVKYKESVAAATAPEKKEEPAIYSNVQSKESVAAATAPEKKEEPAIYSNAQSKESVAAVTAPEKKEEPAIYSNAQSKESVAAATAPEKKEEPAIYSEAKPKKSSATAPNGKAAAHCHIRLLLLLCLGILCILLVVAVIVIVVHIFSLTKEKDREEAKLSVMTAENKQLTSLIRDMENKTEKLMRDRDDLNHTLGVILKFNSFPVTEFCSGPMVTDCNPCQKDWLLFQDKCYLFYKEGPRWKTWRQSREICQNKFADLVIIDNQEEQEFISNYTTYYFNDNHGYWIGLREINNDWVWIDGRNDTLGYWIPNAVKRGPFALLIPRKAPTESWTYSDNAFENRFVCEMETLIRSR